MGMEWKYDTTKLSRSSEQHYMHIEHTVNVFYGVAFM